MSNFNQPALSDGYANFLTYLNAKISDIALEFDSVLVSPTNQPTGSKRWNDTAKYWERWNGANWVVMATTYNISVTGSANSANVALSVAWANVSNRPTTLANYSITGSDVASTLGNNPVALANIAINAGNLGGVSSANYPQLTTPNTFTKANNGSVVALTDANSVALNLALANNFSLLLTANIGATRQLANPANAVAGQSGIISVTQDTGGNRALTFGTNYKFAGAATPALTATANAVDYLSYYVETSTRVFVSVIKDIR